MNLESTLSTVELAYMCPSLGRVSQRCFPGSSPMLIAHEALEARRRLRTSEERTPQPGTERRERVQQNTSAKVPGVMEP